MDAKTIVDVVGNPDYVNNIISPILDDCRQLINRFHQVRIKHCFRKANRCADALARLGSNQANDFCVFSSPLVDIIDFLKTDADDL